MMSCMFGSHLSVAGGLHNALIEAKQLRMDCVQVFTKNQRQWKVKPLTDEQIAEWFEHQKTTGITEVVSHDSYLINLASPKKETLDKSTNLFREELLRCEALKIAWLVTHPGAHMGEGEEKGLKRIIKSLDQIHKELKGLKAITCLETTAGQGTSLGWQLEHLKTIMDGVKQPERLGVCIDTAHLIAAGYDLTSADGAADVLEQLENVIGLKHVLAAHINDSKVPLGKRVDRHEHIGHGHVDKKAFGTLLANPHIASIPKILETAKGEAPNGKPWDSVNMATLKRLQKAALKK